MPFYEYECSSCKFYSEVLQKISDTPLKKCPNCSKQTFKRLISAPVFRLKGGGWYETDFKSDGENKRNLAGREEAESKSEDSKSEGSKTEAKADAKAEAKPAESAQGGEGKRESKGETKRSSKPVKRAPAAKPKKASKPAPKAKKKSKR